MRTQSLPPRPLLLLNLPPQIRQHPFPRPRMRLQPLHHLPHPFNLILHAPQPFSNLTPPLSGLQIPNLFPLVVEQEAQFSLHERRLAFFFPPTPAAIFALGSRFDGGDFGFEILELALQADFFPVFGRAGGAEVGAGGLVAAFAADAETAEVGVAEFGFAVRGRFSGIIVVVGIVAPTIRR